MARSASRNSGTIASITAGPIALRNICVAARGPPARTARALAIPIVLTAAATRGAAARAARKATGRNQASSRR